MSFLEDEMQKLGANQKVKSGIFYVLESGICTGRIRNPTSGIRNPQLGIQNLILSWITLHGVSQWAEGISAKMERVWKRS